MATKEKKKNKSNRLKFFMYGPAGVGKTVAHLQLFKNSFIIDTENGTDRYLDYIEEAGSKVVNTSDIDEVRNHINWLLTEKHHYTTLVIDPSTKLYSSTQEKWDAIFKAQAERKGNTAQLESGDWGFGFWGKVKADYKRLMDRLNKLDMNIVMTAHQKDQYSGTGNALTKSGVTFDDIKGADYLFDIVFRMFKSGDDRWVETIKERCFPDPPKFLPKFKWEAEEVLKVWGEENICKEAEVLTLANPEQCLRIEELVSILGVQDDQIAKWNLKAGAECWEEYPQEFASKTLGYLESKLPK